MAPSFLLPGEEKYPTDGIMLSPRVTAREESNVSSNIHII